MGIAIIRSLSTLRSVVNRWKRSGESIAVVMTPGDQHAGHLTLAREGRNLADRLIVTVFANPRLSNARLSQESADRMPQQRHEGDDAIRLGPIGVDVLYAPEATTLYPEGFASLVTTVLGAKRGQKQQAAFNEIATEILKLLLQTGADVALFSESDIFRLYLARQLVRDLDLPVTIKAYPIVREQDGLAASSDNKKLDIHQRQIAAVLASTLHEAAQRITAGESVQTILKNARKTLISAGFTMVDYLDLCAEDDLRPVKIADVPARLLASAWIDNISLSDNIAVAPVKL